MFWKKDNKVSEPIIKKKYKKEINGIMFESASEENISPEKITTLSQAYMSNINLILNFMLNNGLRDFYSDISMDNLEEKLGKPTIDIDIKQVCYLDHSLDKSHIISYRQELL